MTESKIIFYDLASNRPEFCWSLNTWKTRITLNYKGIPYKTEWLEFPEIEEKCKEMGIPPSSTRPDGSGVYTVPAIWDPRTKVGISESNRIAQYLDKTYPDTPSVLFDGIEVYDQVINSATNVPELRSLGSFLMPYHLSLQNPVSQEYYKRKIEARFGKNWEDVLPTGEAKVEAWKSVEKGFDILDALLRENARPSAEDGQLSYLDIALGGRMYAFRSVWGEENELWQDMVTWNDGRWGKYIEKVEKFATPKKRDS
ncbi:hypothetical protein M378DRAFT_26957 [Amanita muscaria Koide BX008]|uniref:GST N-terminal domain-containing protein n=1 Tax=Amanita muscaria (strain Koide BX008) TaxID=946122 RepID=A0A0C2S9U3_AMAMK|nr:hypothetical protein M378DRAFT_26957 [Amanita muscaria Koide BX008]